MKACAEWKEPLIEAALGNTTAELEHHLLSCLDCRAAFVEMRSLAGQMDGGLNDLVRSAELTPDFRAHVMRRVAEPSRKVWGWPAWTGPAAVAALVAVAVVFLSRNEPKKPAEIVSVAALSEWRSPTESLLRPAVYVRLQSKPRFADFYFPIESTDRRGLTEKIRRNQ